MFRATKRQRGLLLKIGIALLVGTGILTSISAFGQTTPDEQELRLRSRQETEDRMRRQQAPVVRIPTGAAPPAVYVLPKESPCFATHDIRLEGTRLDTFPWAQPYLDHYRNQCIGIKGLNLILKRLSEKFIAKGYITTRVLLPSQDLSKGSLTFLLVPGVISGIRFNAKEPDRLWRSAFPMRPGDVLNLRDIEQGLEQLKRVPSQDVNFKIVPGPQQGGSDIVIDIKRTKPWRVVVSADNAGQRATGEFEDSVAAYLDNPFDMNDILSVSINGDMEHKGAQLGTRGNSASYSMPWGYWTATISTSTYQYHQTVQGTTQSFISSGDIESTGVSVNRVVARDQVSKTSLQLGVTKSATRSYIDDTEVTVQRRDVTSAELSILYRRYIGRAQLDGALAYREGLSWFGAQSAPSAAGQPTTRYKIQTIDLNLVAPFSDNGVAVRYIGSLRMQTTDDLLYTSNFISIGNRYTVRGFDGEQTLAAERGWYLRNEIEYPVDGKSNFFYFGIDHGEVSGPSAGNLIGTALTGSVIGLRGGRDGFSYDIFAGLPLYKPDGFITDNVTVGGQINYQF